MEHTTNITYPISHIQSYLRQQHSGRNRNMYYYILTLYGEYIHDRTGRENPHYITRRLDLAQKPL